MHGNNARSSVLVYSGCRGIILSLCNSQFVLNIPFYLVMKRKEKQKETQHESGIGERCKIIIYLLIPEIQ